MTILLMLAEFLGLKGLKGLSVGLVKWTVRLVLLVVLIVGIIILHRYGLLLEAALGLAALWLAWVVGRAWWRRLHRGAAVMGERTIDGKLVPEKLAVAALAVPEQSPEGEYVLRGLPDYGKVLLKLASADFEYIPPAIPEKAPESPLLQSPARRFRLPVPSRGWGIAAGIAALLVVAGVVISQTPWRTFTASAKAGSQQQRKRSFDDPYANTYAKAAPAQEPARSIQQTEAQQQIAKIDGVVAAAEARVKDQPPATAAGLTWTDGASGRVWTTQDSGQPVNWQEATDYCNALRLDGRRDWRLPEVKELAHVWDKEAGRFSFHLGDKPVLWTNTGETDVVEQAYAVVTEGAGDISLFGTEKKLRAVCVSGAR